MPKKTKLNLEDLNVESFLTAPNAKGGRDVNTDDPGGCVLEDTETTCPNISNINTVCFNKTCF